MEKLQTKIKYIVIEKPIFLLIKNGIWLKPSRTSRGFLLLLRKMSKYEMFYGLCLNFMRKVFVKCCHSFELNAQCLRKCVTALSSSCVRSASLVTVAAPYTRGNGA